jgi:hypothetical protein
VSREDEEAPARALQRRDEWNMAHYRRLLRASELDVKVTGRRSDTTKVLLVCLTWWLFIIVLVLIVSAPHVCLLTFLCMFFCMVIVFLLTLLSLYVFRTVVFENMDVENLNCQNSKYVIKIYQIQDSLLIDYSSIMKGKYLFHDSRVLPIPFLLSFVLIRSSLALIWANRRETVRCT